MDLWSDLGKWGILYSPPVGSRFDQVAELVLKARAINSLVGGFLFHGEAICIKDGDTVESLAERYRSDNP